jgi:hypothetical protein
MMILTRTHHRSIDKVAYKNYTQVPICGIVFTAETSNLKSGIVIGGTPPPMMCAEDIYSWIANTRRVV